MARPDPTVLDALADRVEAGEEGGAIEVEIEEALYEKPRMPPPNITESLDAIEAARERLLPDEMYASFRIGERLYLSRQFSFNGDNYPVEARSTTERHARLAALLRAVAAKVRAEG